MAANQAADVAGQHVIVIPTKTVPQGMAALLAFNPALGADFNIDAVNVSVSDRIGDLSAFHLADRTEHSGLILVRSKGRVECEVKSGQITYAVRDTNIDGIDIKKGDFMGILNGKIVETASDQLAAAKKLLAGMIDEDSEIVTVIKGEDAPDVRLADKGCEFFGLFFRRVFPFDHSDDFTVFIDHACEQLFRCC